MEEWGEKINQSRKMWEENNSEINKTVIERNINLNEQNQNTNKSTNWAETRNKLNWQTRQEKNTIKKRSKVKNSLNLKGIIILFSKMGIMVAGWGYSMQRLYWRTLSSMLTFTTCLLSSLITHLHVNLL